MKKRAFQVYSANGQVTADELNAALWGCLPVTQKICWLFFAEDSGNGLILSADEIADKIGYSGRQVKRGIAEIKERGLFNIAMRFAENGYQLASRMGLVARKGFRAMQEKFSRLRAQRLARKERKLARYLKHFMENHDVVVTPKGGDMADPANKDIDLISLIESRELPLSEQPRGLAGYLERQRKRSI